MDAVETPQYLYKILSYRNWQATEKTKAVLLSSDDKEFIHFSTEEQIERIVGKYWADAPQFAVLKVESAKLQGRLKLETNPGGTNRYYHLYDGFIPIQGIAEVKIVFREPLAACKCFDIVQVGDPVLRQKTRTLSKEEILSPEIQARVKARVRTHNLG